MAARNVVVAQSGGPTCVINNSLRGIVETCRRHPQTFGTSTRAISASRAFSRKSCSTCRRRPKKRSRCCAPRRRPAASAPAATSSRKGKTWISSAWSTSSKPTTSATSSTSAATTRKTPPTRSASWPRTAGSTWSPSACPRRSTTTWATRVHLARPFARLRLGRALLRSLCRQANEENAGSAPADPVLVIQAMGRKIGFIPAAARLADPERKMPHPDLPDRVGADSRAARRERDPPARNRRPVHRGRQRGIRRGRLWAGQRQLRPRSVQLQPADGRPDRGELSQHAQVPRAGQGPRPGSRHRPAQCHRLRQRHRSGRGLRRRLPRRGDRPQGGKRLDGDDPSRSRPCGLQRPLRQGSARDSRELRALLPQALARPQPDRRDRRIPGLCPALDR